LQTDWYTSVLPLKTGTHRPFLPFAQRFTHRELEH
jgi:hypothetical protein